jgi:hypothetical protein
MNYNLMVSMISRPTSVSGALAPDNLFGEKPMTKIKTLTALVILSTAVATPVFAKGGTYHKETFRGAYNQMTEPSFAVAPTRAERNIQNFGFSGRDPSRVGGWDPSLNPPS